MSEHIDNPFDNPDGRSWDLGAEMAALGQPDDRTAEMYVGGLALADNTAIVTPGN